MNWDSIARPLLWIAILAAVGFLALKGARLLWRATLWLTMARRGATALKALGTAVGGALYGVSPVDAVPDVIVGVGWVDDLLVLGLAAWYLARLWRSRQASRLSPRHLAVPMPAADRFRQPAAGGGASR